MKLVEYAPYILGFLILTSLALLVAGIASADEVTTGTGPSTISIEVHTVRVITQNDTIGTPDYGIDAMTKSLSLSKK